MKKIEELLKKHKNNIAKWYDNIEFRELSWWNFRLYLRNEPWDVDYISFCEILFNTPFLSLLEWNDGIVKDAWIRQEMGTWKFIEWHSIYNTYHKINLALLESDKERVDYISNFTL